MNINKVVTLKGLLSLGQTLHRSEIAWDTKDGVP